MLSKRNFLVGVTASGLMHALPIPAFPQSGNARPGAISNVQINLKLETTVGSLLGAALGSLIYLVYAKAASAELVAAFTRAVIDYASSSNLKYAAEGYVEFKASEVNFDIRESRQSIMNDTISDVHAYNRLSAVVQQQTKNLISLQNNVSSSVRELREQLAEVRKEIEIVRFERERAFSSTSVYGSVEQQTRQTRINKSNELENVIGEAKKGSSRLSKHCRALEDQILRM